MPNVKVWYAKNATVKIMSGTVFTNTASLATTFASGSVLTGIMKDVSITEPIGDIDKVDLLGTDGAGFQNAEVEEKPAGLGEISGTLIVPGTNSFMRAFGVLYGTAATAAPSGYVGYKPGFATRQQKAILVEMTDGTNDVQMGIQYAFITARDIKVTGADGHFEGSFSGKFLPRDYRINLK
jgi:hypothetical protein